MSTYLNIPVQFPEVAAGVTAVGDVLQFAIFDGASSIVSYTVLTQTSATPGGGIKITQGDATSGALSAFWVLTGAHTALTASTEVPSVLIDMSATKEWATGALAAQHEFKLLAPTLAFVGASTVSLTSTFYISGAPIAGANATLTEKHALYVASGSSRFLGRILGGKGANVTAANDMTLGADGNVFGIVGTTTINGIASAGWKAGAIVVLLFGASVTVKHDTAASAGFDSFQLAGAGDFSATDNDTLTLMYSGTHWVEMARTVI